MAKGKQRMPVCERRVGGRMALDEQEDRKEAARSQSERLKRITEEAQTRLGFVKRGKAKARPLIPESEQ